jgi:hypothetical protein
MTTTDTLDMLVDQATTIWRRTIRDARDRAHTAWLKGDAVAARQAATAATFAYADMPTAEWCCRNDVQDAMRYADVAEAEARRRALRY